MIPLSEFPAIDATLNATSALLLTLGYFLIRRKRIQAHKVCMLSAFATSSLFLGRYPVPRSPRCHALRQARRRSRSLPGTARFAHNSRGGHPPLILTTLDRAWRGRFERHKEIARWTLPLWFYVSVTGVVVYWMLYHLYVAAR
jgi:putative membrane protein